MGDSSSPSIFRPVFEYLAKENTTEARVFARKMWKLSGDFDFCDEDLDCDKALIALGLATRDGDDVEYKRR